ncbi:MAG: PEP-CTERM sorting domain-containing protein [Chthonomonas sp.]|nr:PEP-CTERM sorting domain-containing protein [Chthonomonas sp.]
MRTVAALCLLGSVGLAHASFDVMFLPDTATGRIVRFDPVNQVALGSFGPSGSVGFAGRYASVIDPNRVAYTGSGGTVIYNPNNGEATQTGTIADTFTRATMDGAGLLEAFNTSVYRYDLFLARTSVDTGLTTNNGLMPIGYNDFIAQGVNASGDLVARRVTGMVPGATTTMLLASAINPTSFGASQGKFTGNTFRQHTVCLNAANQLRLMQVTVNLTSFAVTTSLNTFQLSNQFLATSKLSVVPAHAGYYVIGDDASNAAVTRIIYYGEQGMPLANFTTTAVDVPTTTWGAGIILAPEPSSLGVFAVAGAMMLRRRRR